MYFWRAYERNYHRYVDMPGVQIRAEHRDAYRLLSVPLRMRPLSRCVEATDGGLLRVLLLRRRQMSLNAGQLEVPIKVPESGKALERGRLRLARWLR